MKKINKYIIAAVIPLFGMMAACTDDNDWTTDSSVNRLRAPEGLSVEVDSTTLNMELKWNKSAGAQAYQVQVSETPIAEGFDETPGIPTFTATESPLTIERLNDQFEIKENTTYYVRLRAISDVKSPSKWATDDIASGTLKTKSPATLWIDDTGVGETTITMRWIKVKYANVTTILNQTTGESHEITKEEKSELSYTATGLQDGVEYTFVLLDDEGNQLGIATKATEKSPNMDWAMSIMDLSGWIKGGEAILTDGAFKMTLNDHGGKFKGEDKSIRMISPLNEVGEKLTYYRFTTNTKEFYSVNDYILDEATGIWGYDPAKSKVLIKLDIPAAGRLYAYAYTGTAGRKMVVSRREFNTITNALDEEVIFSRELDSNIKDNAKEGEAVNYEKVYIKQPGEYFVSSPDGGIYIYGFIFVPDEEFTAEQ